MIIGNGVTSIGSWAFSDCIALTSITIPDGVTSIGKKAFYYCRSLKSFYGKFASNDNRCLIIDGELRYFAPAELTSYNIPDGVTSIGDEAFRECGALTSIIIPECVTSIGWCTFYDCDALQSITIPEGVTEIGDYAFEKCDVLANVYCKATTPPSIQYSTFASTPKLINIYVPTSSVDAYKSANYWKKYADKIVGYNF